MRIPAHLVLLACILCGVSLSESTLAQQPIASTSPKPSSGIESLRLGGADTTVNLEISIQGPDKTTTEEAAVTLFTLSGEAYKQGAAKKGRLLWNEITPSQYKIEVIAPGFERTLQSLDVRSPGEVMVDIQLKPESGGETAYPPVSSDPEVDYVFGRYASELGDWDQAKSYWTKGLELQPYHVPTVALMGEALVHEGKDSEAREYLQRAVKMDPAYWRTQAVFAELSMRVGSPREAVQHAEQALELGRDEAAGISPLLAQALAARANQVLRAYLKDHPEDAVAKKQLEELNASALSAAAAKPASSREPRWLPPEIDETAPPVEPGATCNLGTVLQKAGQRIQELVKNVDRFTATEFLVHESLSRSGKAFESEKRKYDYVVSIEEIRPGILNVDEYQSNGPAPADSPEGWSTKGLPVLALIFHPYYSETFSMKCEGLSTWNGKKAWQVYFRQREDKPNKIRSYRVGTNTPSYPVALKGRAWFVADTYQILGLQTDLVGAIPGIRLTAEHTDIQYGPVNFSSRGQDMWLPQVAEVFSELRGKRIHRKINFSNYLLFAVDDKQQIAAPKTNP